MSTIITEKPQNVTEEKRNRFNNIHEFKELVLNKFIDGSGIDVALLQGCIEFHQDVETSPWGDVETPIHEELGWKYTRFGFQANEPLYAAFLKNEDGTTWQAILSIWDEERQRPYKYYAPKDIGDRAFLPPVPNNIRKKIASKYGVEVPTVQEGSFWEWVKTCKIPKILTEGAGKGLSLISQGYIGIALYGCSCGGRIDKYGLIDDLKQLNQEESIWLFGLDRDTSEKTKRRVNEAKKQLKLTLESDGVKFYVEDIFWRAEDGKGADDLIVNKGSGAFDGAYQSAINRLEKQFKNGGYSSENDSDWKPKELKVAQELAEKYRDILAFNNDITSWMRYAQEKEGIWFQETNDYIKSVVYKILVSEGYKNFKVAFVNNVTEFLKCELILREWEEKPANELLPFTNGVYSMADKKLLKHSPGYRLTWQLPRNYEPDGTWDNINQYLDHLSGNNSQMKDILLCYCNAILKGRSDLQKCLYLIGLPQTGKGTFLRLVTEMVGKENIHATKLEIFCADKFDVGNVRNKRLVLFSDQEPYSGSVSEFLSLTGEDNLRGERKNKDAIPFRFNGMPLIAANHPVFSGRHLNAVKRRLITFPCKNPVPEEMKKDLMPVFESEIGAFTAYILTIPDDHVTKVLSTTDEVAESNIETWENRIASDSLASWINYHLIPDPLASTSIGSNKNEWRDGQVFTLFGSYSKYVELTSNANQRKMDTFSKDTIDLCNLMGWNISFKKTNKGRFLQGVRLRVDGQDDHIPSYDILLDPQSKVTGGDGLSDGLSDGLKSLLHKESDGGDGGDGTSSDVLTTESISLPEAVGTEVVHTPETTPVDTEANAELLRTCINEKSWGMITDLTEEWTQEFKNAVWALLTQAERDAIKNMKPVVQGAESVAVPPRIEIFRDGILPVFIEKEKYFSVTHQVMVQIYMINDTLKTCSCDVPIGGKVIRADLDFSDLKVGDESYYIEINQGDKVEILTGKYKGKQATISSSMPNQGPVFLNIEGVKATVSCKTYFWGHQIKKI